MPRFARSRVLFLFHKENELPGHGKCYCTGLADLPADTAFDSDCFHRHLNHGSRESLTVRKHIYNLRQN